MTPGGLIDLDPCLLNISYFATTSQDFLHKSASEKLSFEVAPTSIMEAVNCDSSPSPETYKTHKQVKKTRHRDGGVAGSRGMVVQTRRNGETMWGDGKHRGMAEKY